MNLLEKIKLLFRVKAPVEEIFGELREIKRGWKTFSFWFTFVGSLLALVAALTGLIPGPIALCLTTALTIIYSVLRGLKKGDEVGVRPVFQTTEFWIGVLNSLFNGLISLQTGGIHPEWLVTTQTIMAGVMGASQNMGAQQPAVEK